MTKTDRENLEKLCKKLRVKLDDLHLLQIALTHRSYPNEHKERKIKHNERLEFLGDAVLELAVSIHLFNNYPDRPEGDLTSFRAATVRTESLTEEAKELGLGNFIRMSKGEEKTGGKQKSYILANTFEAVVGTIYLDLGFQVVQKFLSRVLFYKIPKIIENRLDMDDKSKLQEISQRILRETPTYKTIGSTGPDHNKQFTVAVIIKSNILEQGSGANKQTAEQVAAKHTLANWDTLIAKYFNID